MHKNMYILYEFFVIGKNYFHNKETIDVFSKSNRHIFNKKTTHTGKRLSKKGFQLIKSCFILS